MFHSPQWRMVWKLDLREFVRVRYRGSTMRLVERQ